jgi:adenylosuccinate synthase
MSHYSAVIGAAYGDEGKGRTVATLATSSQDLVVRYNGGAQAGHTVVKRFANGDRQHHIFSHFGSGTLNGARTYLGKEFVCNPAIWRKEASELQKLWAGRTPSPIYVNVNCPITTPWEMAINQMIEYKRGNDRHGSVGVGFGETLERESRGCHFRICDCLFESHDKWYTALMRLRGKWFDKRIKELGFRDDDELRNRFQWAWDYSTMSRFIEDVRMFFGYISHFDTNAEVDFFKRFERVVFEGAQGLMLDQHIGDWPHVTRSNTGLKNILPILRNNHLDVHYVTRAYTTRHGAGPFPMEEDGTVYGIYDETNTMNEHQGQLRTSYLNFDTLRYAITRDVTAHYKPKMNIRGVMTCLDQLNGERIKYILHGKIHEAACEAEIIKLYSEIVGGPVFATRQR